MKFPKISKKYIDILYFLYIVIIVLAVYFLSRFLFGRKEIEGFTVGFTFAGFWNGILMFFFNFWYSIYNFWKNVILFWINMYDYFFAQWLWFINTTTGDIKTTGNDISSLSSDLGLSSSGGGGSNVPSGIYDTLSLFGNLAKIAKYS